MGKSSMWPSLAGPEKNDSLDSLISAIQGDIEEAKKRLDLPDYLKLEDKFLQVSKSKIMNGHQ